MHRLSGRDIGEEYRYIIERRASKKFPGNMLTRPGLILLCAALWLVAQADAAPDGRAVGSTHWVGNHGGSSW